MTPRLRPRKEPPRSAVYRVRSGQGCLKPSVSAWAPVQRKVDDCQPRKVLAWELRRTGDPHFVGSADAIGSNRRGQEPGFAERPDLRDMLELAFQDPYRQGALLKEICGLAPAFGDEGPSSLSAALDEAERESQKQSANNMQMHIIIKSGFSAAIPSIPEMANPDATTSRARQATRIPRLAAIPELEGDLNLDPLERGPSCTLKPTASDGAFYEFLLQENLASDALVPDACDLDPAVDRNCSHEPISMNPPQANLIMERSCNDATISMSLQQSDLAPGHPAMPFAPAAMVQAPSLRTDPVLATTIKEGSSLLSLIPEFDIPCIAPRSLTMSADSSTIELGGSLDVVSTRSTSFSPSTHPSALGRASRSEIFQCRSLENQGMASLDNQRMANLPLYSSIGDVPIPNMPQTAHLGWEAMQNSNMPSVYHENHNNSPNALDPARWRQNTGWDLSGRMDSWSNSAQYEALAQLNPVSDFCGNWNPNCGPANHGPGLSGLPQPHFADTPSWQLNQMFCPSQALQQMPNSVGPFGSFGLSQQAGQMLGHRPRE